MGAEKRKLCTLGAEKRNNGCGEEITLYFGATVHNMVFKGGVSYRI